MNANINITTSKTPRTIEHEGFWAIARAARSKCSSSTLFQHHPNHQNHSKIHLALCVVFICLLPKGSVTSEVVLPPTNQKSTWLHVFLSFAYFPKHQKSTSPMLRIFFCASPNHRKSTSPIQTIFFCASPNHQKSTSPILRIFFFFYSKKLAALAKTYF